MNPPSSAKVNHISNACLAGTNFVMIIHEVTLQSKLPADLQESGVTADRKSSNITLHIQLYMIQYIQI